MNVIFTLCSNNYLAHAKTLGDSVIAHNPSYIFIIGLVDKKDQRIDYTSFSPHIIILVEDIGIEKFDELPKKYNIIEFNTCVKPSYFKFIFNNYKEVRNVFYVDPDIMLFNNFTELENLLFKYDILITPHILSPITYDGLYPSENLFLNYGLYNLGFIGVNRNTVTEFKFLDWWETRTLNLGFNDTVNGYFVDQLWINFVPLFFKNVKILRDFGYNVAPWNLHERTVIFRNNQFTLSGDDKFYFFHFSSYNYREPQKMSKYYDRYKFENFPELKELYNEYHNNLIKNEVQFLSKISCYYMDIKLVIPAQIKTEQKQPISQRLKNLFR